MAREVGAEKAKPSLIDCDLCHERNGKNAAVVHILKFREQAELKAHLEQVFPKSSAYAVEWFSELWLMAHRIYGNEAREKYAPLWLVYLEAHGVKVGNRAEAIMKFRGHENYQG